MFWEGIVLEHKVSKLDIEVNQAKIDGTERMPPPIDIKGVRSF